MKSSSEYPLRAKRAAEMFHCIRLHVTMSGKACMIQREQRPECGDCKYGAWMDRHFGRALRDFERRQTVWDLRRRMRTIAKLLGLLIADVSLDTEISQTHLTVSERMAASEIERLRDWVEEKEADIKAIRRAV